jgi:hypothetical protein
MLSNIAFTANTQSNIGNALAASQDRFNTLRGNAATAALNAGNANAQRDQQALEFNNEIYARGASARQNIMRDSIAQIPAMIGQYYKNRNTLTMRDRMLGLWTAQLDDEARKYYNEYMKHKGR